MKRYLAILLTILFFIPSITYSTDWWLRSLWQPRNPAVSLIGFNNSIQNERGYGYLLEAVYTSGWGYRNLTPSNLTSQKGILMGNGDNLQYSRGSLQGGDGAGVVYENANGNQIGIELWMRPNNNGNDGTRWQILDIRSDTNNQIQLYKNISNNLVLEFKGNGISKTASVSISTWVAGTWYYVTAMADKNNIVDTGQYLQVRWNNTNVSVDGTTVPTALTSLPATFQLGQDYANANQFGGVIAGQIRCLPLTTTEITNRYASGAGHTDTFTVGESTVWFGTYSDSNTNAISWHRGQQIISIPSTTQVNLAEAVSGRSWKSGDRGCAFDGCGDKRAVVLSATPNSVDTFLSVNAVADLPTLGVGATLNGTTQYFSRADNASLSITGNMTIEAWIMPDSLTYVRPIVAKNAPGQKSYSVWWSSGNLGFYVSSDGSAHTTTFTTSGPIPINKWTHVAVVYTAATGAADFYVNGYSVADDGNILPTSIFDSTAIFRIGFESTIQGSYFNGGIRDVAIYNSALTAANILSHATNPLTEANSPVSWWKLTGASTDTTITDNATANNANHLTLVGGTVDTYGQHSRTQQAFISKNLIADGRQGNGGIGGWSPTNATIAKSTTVIKFDKRALAITNAGATQAFARQTITTIAGEDYYFNGWFRTPATPDITTPSRIVDVDLSAALSFTVPSLVPGGTVLANTWYEVDFTFEAADISTTIDLGSGSITNAQIGYWDNVKVHKNLVNNPGMERDGTVDVSLPSAWSTIGTGVTAAYKANTSSNGGTGKVHSGTYSVYVNASNSYAGIAQYPSVVNGKWYTWSSWVYVVTGGTNNVGLWVQASSGWLEDSTAIRAQSTGQWVKLSYTGKANGSSVGLQIRTLAAAATFYIDDVSLIELDQLTPTTATPASDINSYRLGKYNDNSGSFEIKGGATLQYPAINNVQHEEGSLSFAFYPNGWHGGDSARHKLYSLQGHPDEIIAIDKTTANNLEFYYMAADGIPRLMRFAVNSTNFAINTWHHIYCEWRQNVGVDLWLDGLQVGSLISNPNYYGTWHENINQADGYFDDVFVFDKTLKERERIKLYQLAHRASFNELTRRGWW